MGCSGSKSALATVGLATSGDPNSRCSLMMKENTVLASKIKMVSKEVTAFKTSADHSIEGIKQLLATPLPKIYEDDAAASAALMQTHIITVAGSGFSAEAANKAKEDFAHKAAPRELEAWMAKHDEAVLKQKALNKVYDEMVSARNKVASAKAKEETLRRSGLSGEDPKVQQAVHTVQNLQDKLNVSTEKHTHEEAGQYQRLVALANEAAGLGAIIKNRIIEMADGMKAVADVIPEKTQSAPVASSTPAAPAATAPVASSTAPAGAVAAA